MNRIRERLGAAYAYERGIYGKGIGVAVLDSGIEETHPDLRGRVVYRKCFGEQEDTGDECGHGTHISGIIGGTGSASGGRYQGLAPECHFLSLKVLDKRGNGSVRGVIDALYWLVRNGRDYGIRIVNISMGGQVPGAEEEELLSAVDAAWNAGFVICAAAGNQGPEPGSITAPGTSRRIITVGASDDRKTVRMSGRRSPSYSGRGPTRSCICKPDVSAPGSFVTSCQAKWRQRGYGYYCVKSGTSMATPVVCGALALLLCSEPYLTNKEVKLRLFQTCRKLPLPQNQQGWGEIWIPSLLG